MKTKPSWIWKLYLIFITVVTIQGGLDFFVKETSLRDFFIIMTAFDKGLKFIYYINAACAIFNLVSIIPLFFFIYQRPILKPIVWQILFVLRAVFDIIGHTYELTFIKSIFYDSPMLSLKIGATAILILVPSYIATYLYAFRHKEVTLEKQLEMKLDK